MAERMSKEEREALDAKVRLMVAAGRDPYASGPDLVGTSMRDIDASLQRQRRRGGLAYVRKAGAKPKWVVVGPKAKRAPKPAPKASRVGRGKVTMRTLDVEASEVLGEVAGKRAGKAVAK